MKGASNVEPRRVHSAELPRVLIALRDGRIRLRLAALKRTLAEILVDHGAEGALSLAIVDDEEIRRVHREFLDDDTPTDVISFLLRAPEDAAHEPFLGEVVVSAETALREARKRGLPPAREVALYAIHGALHVVGFDDLDAAKKRKMRRAERRYLARYEAPTSPPRSIRRRGARRRRRTPRPARA